MSGVIGVELSTDRVRAVVPGGWRSAAAGTFETAWDPTRPDDVVGVLRQQFGAVSRISLSIGLGFLHVKQVTLPPVPIADRRRMLEIQPDRFFPVQGESIVVALTDRNLAFAVDAGLLEHWVTAFEAWAPVDLVEPSPLSLARALGRRANGVFLLPALEGESGVVEVRDGAVHGVRRIPRDAVPGASPVPAGSGVAGEFQAAVGAARAGSVPLEAALLARPHAARIGRRRLLRTLLAGTTAVAALVLATWSVDQARERTLDRVRAEITRLEPQATRAVGLLDQLNGLDAESATISTIMDRRPDPLRVLEALSERLPDDVTVLDLRADGDGWQINGRAADAAAILPVLDGDARFDNVRFLSASSRFREGDRTWETFSIAFRVRPPA